MRSHRFWLMIGIIAYLLIGAYFATVTYALTRWGGSPDWPRIIAVLLAWPLVWLWEQSASAL